MPRYKCPPRLNVGSGRKAPPPVLPVAESGLNNPPRSGVAAGMNSQLIRAALLLLALPATLLAQPRHGGWEHRRERDEPRVYLYEHADFRGGVIVLRPGDFVENLAGWNFDNGRLANDRISSIRIEGDAEVTLYVHAGFRGEALRIDRDLRDLGSQFRGRVGFNDQISSLRVRYDRDERGPGRDRPIVIDYDGIIRRAYQDILERAADERGLRHYRSMMIDRRWSETDVRENLRRSDEYRLVAERTVVRLYRELLRRDPDPTGLAAYRRLIVDQRWTESQVRHDVMQSAEYRALAQGGSRERDEAPRAPRRGGARDDDRAFVTR